MDARPHIPQWSGQPSQAGDYRPRPQSRSTQVIPSLSELIEGVERARARNGNSSLGLSFSRETEQVQSPQDAVTPPYDYYTHAQYEVPIRSRPAVEEQGWAEQPRREQEFSVPRRHPTPPRYGPPETVGRPYERSPRGYGHQSIARHYENSPRERDEAGRLDSHQPSTRQYESSPRGYDGTGRYDNHRGDNGPVPTVNGARSQEGYPPPLTHQHERPSHAGYLDNTPRQDNYPPMTYSPGYPPTPTSSQHSNTYRPDWSDAHTRGRALSHEQHHHHHHHSAYHPAPHAYEPPIPSPNSASPRGHRRSASSSTHDEADAAGRRRRNFPPHIIRVLKEWALKRVDDLRFTAEEKEEIARATGLEKKQVDGWYINYHRRGYPKDRWDHYRARLDETEAALVAATKKQLQGGWDGAGEEVERLEVLAKELRGKEREARARLEEHQGGRRAR